MPDAISQAADLMRERLRAIDDERQRLESALRTLGHTPAGRNGTATKGKSSTRPARSAAANRRRRKIAPAGQRREQLLAHLAKKPGSTASEIADAIGVTRTNVQNVLRSAITDTAIKRKDRGYMIAGG
jgi:DNA invertase Pin-like site-specific DNA recombinase